MRISDSYKNAVADISKQMKDVCGNQPADTHVHKVESNVQDIVDISEQGRQKVQNARDELVKMQHNVEELRRQMELAREQGNAAAKAWETRLKCLLIAMRIMTGDEVPKEDYRYLAKNDTTLYARAITLRIEKEDPQKHKRVSDGGESDRVENMSGFVRTRRHDKRQDGCRTHV